MQWTRLQLKLIILDRSVLALGSVDPIYDLPAGVSADWTSIPIHIWQIPELRGFGEQPIIRERDGYSTAEFAAAGFIFVAWLSGYPKPEWIFHFAPESWTNTQNGTKGSLIDLVAAHKNKTFLQAIAEINGNPRLLLLEQHFGAQRRTYTSFHVPDGERASGPPAVKRLAELLSAHGARPELAESLLKSHPVHVSKSGSIRFFGKGEEGGAVEYAEEAPGKWQRKNRGEARSPFISVPGRSSKATIFTDPMSFLSKAGPDTLSGRKGADWVLALLSPDTRGVDLFLAENPHVNRLEVVTGKAGKPTPDQLDFFNTLKSRYHHLEIGIDLVGPEHAIRGRGPEISFF